MAEEILDDRFKSEVMRLLNTVIVKLGDHDKNFENIDQRFENIDQRFENIDQRFESIDQRFDNLEKDVFQIKTDVKDVKTDVKILKGQFGDVAVMAIEDNKRITKLEKDVEDLQSNIH